MGKSKGECESRDLSAGGVLSEGRIEEECGMLRRGEV